MTYDIFFSISQTPVDGVTPSEQEMFANAFRQLEAADELGFGVAWFAESHLSSEVQKRNTRPVIPHWDGEVGLNANFLNMATHGFARTKNIEFGSAVMNIVCMGGPLAHAERIATTLALHGLNPEESRRLHVGFSAGRFQFMNEATGIRPRDAVEAAAWPALRGLVFKEACEIFLRALRGDVFSSEHIPPTVLSRANFWTEEHWHQVQAAAETQAPEISIAPRWTFEDLELVPRHWRRELLQLVVGSHDPRLQEHINTLLPVQVFNLSITDPAKIEDTHRRMQSGYHPDGGPWQRGHMPRTTFVFINELEAGPDAKRRAARQEAEKALSAYWKALQGTIDPNKIANAADNALVGDAEQIAAQIRERFHPEDRLMLWFDFFNHDCDRVTRNMRDFMEKVVPLLDEG